MRRIENSIDADKLKGVLITRTAIKTLMPEDLVEKIIMFQFKDIKNAISEYEQVEISGFGKFMTSRSKIKKKIERMEGALIGMDKKIKERPDQIPANRLAVWDKMTQDTKDIVAQLKTKKGGYENKYKRYTGGDMELNLCKGGDREDSPGENGDM